MEKKTGILLIPSDRLGQSPDAGAPTTKTKWCETLDSCMERLRNYMQEVTTYHPMGLWTDNGSLVTINDACKKTQHRYEGYNKVACKDMVQYIFTYRTTTGEPLAIVTMIFNDFYKG